METEFEEKYDNTEEIERRARQLTALRKRRGFSQRAMADKLKISRTYYNRVEKGREVLSPRKIDEACRILDGTLYILEL